MSAAAATSWATSCSSAIERGSWGCASSRGPTRMAANDPPPPGMARRTAGGTGHSPALAVGRSRSEEHTSELQSQSNLVCRLLLEKKKNTHKRDTIAALMSEQADACKIWS